MANERATGSSEQAGKERAQGGAAKGQQGQGAQQGRGTEQQAGSAQMARRGAASPGGLSRARAGLPALFGRGAWGGSPFGMMRRMLEDMDRLFDEYFPARFGPQERRELQGPGAPFFAAWEPQIDVLQREGKLLVRADLPGMSKDDVRVEITDDGLLLEGERRSEIEEEREGTYRAERSYGSFRRIIPLPEGCDASGAEAHFENGVLEITLPMPEARPQARRIEIQEGRSGSSTMH